MGRGAVPVRVYRPLEPPGWTMVFAHGGGFSWGTLDDYGPIARNLSSATGARVISVAYRLAPQHAFPAGLDDLCAVAREVMDAPEAGHGVILAGDSAGGCLAAGAAQRLRDEGLGGICGQLLIYPMIEFYDRTPAAFHTLSSRFHPSFEAVRNAWQVYLALPDDQLPPYAVPTRAPSLSGLPPAMTILAENDPLRFEAADYARQLAVAGVPSQTLSYDGTAHGFLNGPPLGMAAKALADIHAWLTALAEARRDA